LRIAVAGLFLQMALGAVYAWSVFRIPLAVQFGWSIPEVTLTFNISILVVGIAAFAGGLWMEIATGRVSSRPARSKPAAASPEHAKLGPSEAAPRRGVEGSARVLGSQTGSSAADRGGSELSAGRRPGRY